MSRKLTYEADENKKKRSLAASVANAFLPFSLLLAVIIFWELSYKLLSFDFHYLPPPSRVIKSLIASRQLLIFHTGYTLLEAFIGFLLALVVSAVLSLLIDSSKFLKRALYPLLVVSQTIPIIAVAPLFIVLFGFGILPKVIVVALVCFFPIVISMVDGLEAADKDMVDLLKVMGATNWQIFRLVRFPAALVSIFSGLKIAATYSVMGAVIGEWVGARHGLGLFMILVQRSFRTDQLLAAIFVITAASLVFFAAIEMLARKMMPWHYSGNNEDKSFFA